MYRQMPELIERGHIYIGQPPLYKVKKGKQETYLKDDDEMNEYLLNRSLDDVELTYQEDLPPMTGDVLYRLIKQQVHVKSVIERLSLLYDRKVIDQLLSLPKINPAVQAVGDAWIKQAEELLNEHNRLGVSWKVRDQADINALVFEKNANGLIEKTTLGHMFFTSNDYQQMMEIAEQNHDLLSGKSVLKKGDQLVEINSLSDVLEYLLSVAKKGLTISRFKGLGEMNPDQLWETTMNPETRRLLQVTIEDAVSADTVFSTLMGDVVEPRRQFIEENALNASNLDV
jgi:DNA gyrase subunit B